MWRGLGSLRLARGVGAIALVGTALAAPAPATATGPTTTCKLTIAQEEHSGPSYLVNLSVSGGPTCAQGVALVKAYYSCRVAHGGARGRCNAPVLGYRCTESPRTSSPVEFIATVTCLKGAARIVHRYSQFTS